jgi:hypothetical protein
MSDLERELESELHRVLDPISAVPIPPRRTAGARSATRTVIGGAGAALTVKLLTGVAVAAAAVTVAGAATTGSVNPLTWGQQVSQHVADCKAKLSDGQHGIGDCVSAFASQHGQAVASDARHHGNGNGNGNGAANAHGNNPNANDHAKDKTKKGDQSHQGDPTDPAAEPPVKITPAP